MDTFILQSASCNSTLCTSYNHSGFNSSHSSTYVPSSDQLIVSYAAADFKGNISKDVLNIAGIEIPSQKFLDAIDIWPSVYFHYYYEYNGVIGLAPAYRNGRPQLPTVWESLINGGSLDRNIFSVSLPTGDRDFQNPRTDGELTLGGLPPNFDEEKSASLPLDLNPDNPFWSTTLESLTYGNFTFTIPGRNGMAHFSTAWPWMTFPEEFAWHIIQTIDPDPHFFSTHFPSRSNPSFHASFACEKRNHLPDLIFGMGGK